MYDDPSTYWNVKVSLPTSWAGQLALRMHLAEEPEVALVEGFADEGIGSVRARGSGKALRARTSDQYHLLLFGTLNMK